MLLNTVVPAQALRTVFSTPIAFWPHWRILLPPIILRLSIAVKMLPAYRTCDLSYYDTYSCKAGHV